MSSLSGFFADSLEAFGDSPAVVTPDGERVTYAELATRADAFAATLTTPGIVAIECENRLEPLIAYLGALRARRPVLLLSAEGAGREALLATYAPVVMLHAKDGTFVRVEGKGSGPPPHPDLAVLLSTSGTTGSPKLVRLSREAVQSNALSIGEYLGLTGHERPITSLPFHYSYGLSVVNSHLACGAALLLTDDSVTAPCFWAFAEREAATSLAGVPYTYELLERLKFRDQGHPHLKTLTQAGGRLPKDLVLRYGEWAQAHGARFFVMYGQTEATARMAYLPPDQVLTRPEFVGVPIPRGRFRLVGEDGHDVAEPGATGELVYSGPNVMMGYAEAPEDLARGAELSELRTGDLAVQDGDGFYRVVGRKSRFAKLFGLRISLDDVEGRAREAGAAAAAASDDQLIAVGVVGGADPAALRDHLAAAYKLPPEAFEVIAYDDLPVLPSGKTDYRGLLAAAQARRVGAGPRASGPDRIVAGFRRAFRKAPQPGDSFVSLGGDSLNYVTLSIEIEDVLGDLPEQWEQLSVAELQDLARQVGARKARWFRPLDVEILIRALAILAVVTIHVSHLPIGGGAHVLLMLSGYNLARYQRDRLATGRAFEVVGSFVRRIILPYYAILVGYLLLKQSFDVPSLLLVSNYMGRRGSLMEPFWFLEALLQCMLIVALIASAKPIQRLIAASPWRFGLALLGGAVLLKAATSLAFDRQHLLERTADSCLFLLALGWCLQEANTNGRRALITACVLAFAVLGVVQPPFWSGLPYPANYPDAIWLAAASLPMLWWPRAPVPALLHGVLTTIAAASFYIYLTHVGPVDLIYWVMGIKSISLNLAVAVALGVAVWWAVQNFEMNRDALLKPFRRRATESAGG